ncbi:LOW QUALITY PROTEIN: hypothetical protein KUTeg_012481 [Tegillarca granosa]|uniref:DNA 3'-5' helicase n=1 Tax=Tegillarca granosa TaxID=220873 RepID=A0ABQ9F353_TEGGR|nr:LOW QUALITY PROTEIN: hypothetical protein KUTeg_012481 [Tegillarca granosa]
MQIRIDNSYFKSWDNSVEHLTVVFQIPKSMLFSLTNTTAVEYRGIFPYQYFNTVQSRVFQDCAPQLGAVSFSIFYSDNPVVLSAPTGSGKTVVFELAIIRLLMKLDKGWLLLKHCVMRDIWTGRSLRNMELKLTGDSELSDYDELQEANIILTTPIAEWLGDTSPALYFKLDESLRPVRLRKVVLGFPFDQQKGSDFQFDMSLNYKLSGIISTYSDDKPTLVFCSTRKSTQQATELLAKDARGTYVKTVQAKQILQKNSNMLKDSKLRDLLVKGIGYHHAGLDLHDRKIIEEVFYNGQLQYYNMGVHEEYSDTQVLQMIGRAGRPQFDTSATAVIMTKIQTKMKYESLLNGTQLIESSLHKNLIEHLNAEIVLHTINDISIAMEWIRYTFLYIRVLKNPKHYGMLMNKYIDIFYFIGMPVGLNKEQVERRLQDLCMKNLNQLAGINLISMDDETFDVKPTEAGRLMARYCIAYETMKKFCKLSASESICDLISITGEDQDKTDESQLQDTTRIFRVAQRIARGLVEMLWLKDDYKTLHNAVLLCKSLKTRLWEDSKHVAKQLDRIGPALSNALVNAGITSFQKIEETNPRELELIRDIVAGLPKYEVTIEQIAKYSTDVAEITISLNLANQEQLLEKKTTSPYHTCILLIGDEDNKVIYKRKIMDSFLMKENGFTKKLEIRRATTGRDLFIDFISQDWVGLDVQSTYTPFYLGPKKISSHTGSANFISNNEQKLQQAQNNSKQQDNNAKHGCNHRCLNKQMCGHECCHTGVTKKSAKTPVVKTPVVKDTRMLNSHLSSLKTKSRMFPETPSAKIFKRYLQHVNSNISTSESPNDYRNLNLQQFAYSPYTKESIIHSPYSTDSMGHFDEQQPSNEETQSLPKLQHQRVGNYTPQYRMDSTTMQQQNSSISEKGRNRETSHDGWTELDMYQRQREEYVDGLCFHNVTCLDKVSISPSLKQVIHIYVIVSDEDMLDISADSPSCYQDNDGDTHYDNVYIVYIRFVSVFPRMKT